MDYNVYGRITKINKGVLSLNTGHNIHVDASDMITDEGQARFAVNQIRFFTLKGTYTAVTGYNHLSYRDSNLVTREDAEEMQVLTRNLDQQTDIVINALKTLNNHDRGQIFKAVGIAVSGAMSLTAAASFLYQGYELCTGGPFNPMNWFGSAGIAVGSAAYCAFLYEQLSFDHQRRANILKNYLKAQGAYSSMMLKYMPWGGSDAKSLNPTVDTLIGKARVMFNICNYKARDFWHNSMQANPDWVAA